MWLTSTLLWVITRLTHHFFTRHNRFFVIQLSASQPASQVTFINTKLLRLGRDHIITIITSLHQTIDQLWSDYFLLNVIDAASKNSGCLHERSSLFPLWGLNNINMLNVRRKEVKYLLNLSIIGLELVISRMHVSFAVESINLSEIFIDILM